MKEFKSVPPKLPQIVLIYITCKLGYKSKLYNEEGLNTSLNALKLDKRKYIESINVTKKEIKSKLLKQTKEKLPKFIKNVFPNREKENIQKDEDKTKHYEENIYDMIKKYHLTNNNTSQIYENDETELLKEKSKDKLEIVPNYNNVRYLRMKGNH